MHDESRPGRALSYLWLKRMKRKFLNTVSSISFHEPLQRIMGKTWIVGHKTIISAKSDKGTSACHLYVQDIDDLDKEYHIRYKFDHNSGMSTDSQVRDCLLKLKKMIDSDKSLSYI